MTIALAVAVLVLLGALAAAWLVLRRATAQLKALDEHAEQAKAALAEVVQREVAARERELEQILVRTRADAMSQLADQERRLSEQRRAVVTQHEREATVSLAEALAESQRRIEERLAGWTDELERSQRSVADELRKVDERQKRLIAEIEARIGAESDTLKSATDEQHDALQRVREEMAREARELRESTTSELEQHAAERRRALHEVAERLRRRERDFQEQIQREAGEAADRLQLGLADVERRQVEQLERVVAREAQRYSERRRPSSTPRSGLRARKPPPAGTRAGSRRGAVLA
jgi:hypothetical protein